MAGIERRRLAFVLPVILFTATAGILGFALTRDPTIIPSSLIDEPAPRTELPSLHTGARGWTDADLSGQVSLVNVFASWCGPCRHEHPLLMRLAESGELRILGINYKDEEEKAKRWLEDLGDPYDRIGVDRDGRIGIDWGVYGIPESFLIDGAGRIRFKQVGPLSAEVIKNQVLPLTRRLRAGEAS